jgi:REP element-mobilizing transposase RayT
MPDHVHVILTPSIDENRRVVVSLVEIMKAMKGASSHAINRHLGSHATIWQEESFDRIVRFVRKPGRKDRLYFAESCAEGLC